MNGRLLRHARCALVAAATTTLCLTVAAPAPAFAHGGGKKAKKKKGGKDGVEETFKQVAAVKVEIKQESGKVIKSAASFDWGTDGRIELPGDTCVHAVVVNVARDPDAKSKVSITLGYEQDGEPVIAAYEFDSTLKHREVIQIEGGIAIALYVAPKKVAVDAPPPEDVPGERETKLEIEGGNDDPLGGLFD